MYDYKIDSTNIRILPPLSDLNVTFNSKFKFTSILVISAHKYMGFIIRNIKTINDSNVLRVQFLSILRTSLEYRSIIGSPMTKIHIDVLEKV